MNMTRLAILPLVFSLGAGVLSQAQDYSTLTGVVIDSQTKESIVGASVRITGTTLGTQSDQSGQFRLKVPNTSSNDTLIVSYVGYQRYAQPIAAVEDKASLRIGLISQATPLKEVIVRSTFWRKQYSPAQLKEDYTKFYTVMEKVHTGLFDYLTKSEWEALKDSSLQLFTYPMSHSQFYHLIALQVGKIKNIHTRHGVTDWWYRQKQNIFPFNIRYFGDKLYISESLVKQVDYPKGCEIIQINGKTPREIKEMIWPYIPADGFNETSKGASLNDYFPWYYSVFVEEAKTYTITLRKLDGDTLTITTPGLEDSFSHLSFEQVRKRKKLPLELTIDDELKTAYFRIEDSRLFNDSLRTYFERIRSRGVQNLIIDLRGEGGIREEEQVAQLYAYLITRPSKIYESIQVKSNDPDVFDKDFSYEPYAKSLKQLKKRYLDKLVDSGDGYFLWQDESYLGLIKPADIPFIGPVYILTDGRNYSASTDFTSIASRLKNVCIVGEETGGEYRSYVSGSMFGLKLPNSKIGVKVATWKSILAIEENPANRGRGVMPDYPVRVSWADFMAGNDVTKKFVFELITKNSKVK